MEYKEYGIWTQESHLTWSDWLQKRLSPTQRHNLLCLWGIRVQLSKMFTPNLSGKVSSNWPWNHETENYSLLKLYSLLCKNTVGIWLEINLASTKKPNFPVTSMVGITYTFKKNQRVSCSSQIASEWARPLCTASLFGTCVINPNFSEERKTSLVYVDWEHSGEKRLEHHPFRPSKQRNIRECSAWRMWRNPQFLGRARFCLFRGMVHEETRCPRAGVKGTLHFQSRDSVSTGWKAFF